MSDPIAKIKKKLQDEIDQLDHELNVDLPKEIAIARAHGDLSENAEYKYAKERQGFVNARIAQLKKRMGDLGMLNLTNIPTDRSGFGSKIVVIDTTKDLRIEYKLVSSEEADVEKGLIFSVVNLGQPNRPAKGKTVVIFTVHVNWVTGGRSGGVSRVEITVAQDLKSVPMQGIRSGCKLVRRNTLSQSILRRKDGS